MAVVIYARKSSESEDRQTQSLEDQLKLMRLVAEREGYDVSEEFVEAKSAKEPGVRPEFNRLLAEITSGKIHGILTWNVNRLTRNMVDGGHIAHHLQAGKLEFIRTPERTYRPEDSALLLAIENGMATSFIQDLRKGVLRGMAGKAGRGWLPGKAPIGYKNNVLTKEIEVDEDNAHYVQRGFEMLASGNFTVADVRRELEGKGFKSRNGSRFSSSKFYEIWRNPFYYGEFVFQGKTYTGKHLPIIDVSVFRAAQKVFVTPLQSRKRSVRHEFAGCFRCPVCGCQITAETRIKHYKTKSVVTKYEYYRCTGYKGCPKRVVAAEVVKVAIGRLADFVKVHARYQNWADTWNTEFLGGLSDSATFDLEGAEQESRRLQQRLKRLRQLRIDEEITEAEFKTEKQETEAEFAKVDAAIAKAKHELEDREYLMAEWQKKAEAVRGFDAMQGEVTRELLNALSVENFLTPEKAIFTLHPAMSLLTSFEPLTKGSESFGIGQEGLSVSLWSSQGDVIDTLETLSTIAKSGSNVKVEIDLDTNVAHQDQDTRIAPHGQVSQLRN